MKRVAQAPSHYEVELRQPDPGGGRTGPAWRPVSLMRTLTFATLDSARTHAARLGGRETRVVVVARDGGRRVVDEAGI
jgi:hypothetical protein